MGMKRFACVFYVNPFASILPPNLARVFAMQKLADYVGLPCRIAQGCKYCTADHQSSCLVIIEDDRKLPR